MSLVNFIYEIFHNRLLLASMISWACAQVIKTALVLIMTRKFDPGRLIGDGGMPSGHSATVASLATSSGLIFGFDSFMFAITAVMAIIVMHDAMNVRLESGKQAKAINDLVQILDPEAFMKDPEKQLKELLGHTPSQVVAGAVLGIVVALIIH